MKVKIWNDDVSTYHRARERQEFPKEFFVLRNYFLGLSCRAAKSRNAPGPTCRAFLKLKPVEEHGRVVLPSRKVLTSTTIDLSVQTRQRGLPLAYGLLQARASFKEHICIILQKTTRITCRLIVNERENGSFFSGLFRYSGVLKEMTVLCSFVFCVFRINFLFTFIIILRIFSNR